MSDTDTQYSVDQLCEEFTQDIQNMHTKPWLLTALIDVVSRYLPCYSPQTVRKHTNIWFKSLQEPNTGDK